MPVYLIQKQEQSGQMTFNKVNGFVIFAETPEVATALAKAQFSNDPNSVWENIEPTQLAELEIGNPDDGTYGDPSVPLPNFVSSITHQGAANAKLSFICEYDRHRPSRVAFTI
jgi:hypothetical protein